MKKVAAKKPAPKKAAPKKKKPAARKATPKKAIKKAAKVRKAAPKKAAKKAVKTARKAVKKATPATRKLAQKAKRAAKKTVKKVTPKKKTAAKAKPAPKKIAPKKKAVAKAKPAKKAVSKKAAPKKAAPKKAVAKKTAPKKPAAKKSVPGNSFSARRVLKVGKRSYTYFSLPHAEKSGLDGISRLPFSMKVLLENLIRRENGRTVTVDDIKAMGKWLETRTSEQEIAYLPARVLMQDFTGVPAVVDLAAMRDAVKNLGGNPKKINPLVPVDLVIDHSVMVDKFGTPTAFKENTDIEYQRNRERYEFLRWGSKAFDNFRVVPPGTGICHQVNLEYLAQTVWTKKDGKEEIAYPDTCVGTDSHTTMVNGLAVLGWGVGGIEAEAADARPARSPMLISEVIGFRVTGKLKEGVTATDMVLTVTADAAQEGRGRQVRRILRTGPRPSRARGPRHHREHGPRIWRHLRLLPGRWRNAEISARYGPFGRARSRWSRLTRRRRACSAKKAWPNPSSPTRWRSTCRPSCRALAGPKRPQDKVELTVAAPAFETALGEVFSRATDLPRVKVEGETFDLGDGDVVIAAITSCTNTSNPSGADCSWPSRPQRALPRA